MNWMHSRSFSLPCFLFTTLLAQGLAAEINNNEAATTKAADHANSLSYFQNLADKGDPVGNYYLGAMYAEGKGVIVQHKKAVEYYSKAAQKGYAPAQFSLGEAYVKGQGTPKDYAMAAKWWQKAAKQGHAQAQYNLAGLYYYGLGTNKNLKQAQKLFSASAEQGHLKAQQALAAYSALTPKKEKLSVMMVAENTDNSDIIEKINELPATASGISQAEQTQDESEDEASAPAMDATDPKTEELERLSAINTEEWVLSQPPENYTIQVFFDRSEEKALKFMEKYNLLSPIAYFSTQHKGKVYTAVVYGSFQTHTSAKLAMQKLPPEIKLNSPWVREYQHIRASLDGLDSIPQIADSTH